MRQRTRDIIIIFILALGWMATILIYDSIYPKTEVKVITEMREVEVPMDCENLACAPCEDEPLEAIQERREKSCTFTMAYQAKKDYKQVDGRVVFETGDIFYYSNYVYPENIRYCSENTIDCLTIEEVTNEEYFKKL